MEQHISDAAQPRRRVRRSAEQWSSLMAEHADSGLSIAAFCRERGLTVSSFHAWRRRLSEERATSATARGFVRLRADDGGGGGDDHGPRQAWSVVVRFVDGVEVYFEGRRLGEVLALLRGGSAADESS
jgi:transposase-like protein